jgi:NADPH:quinone reductase-like Zn-dependent oxidoreductase
MRAFAMTDPDTAPDVTELPDPRPGKGEVLVGVRASSVNGFDAMAASGLLQGMMEHRYPVVLGKDFAGTVEAVGDGASRFAIGDAVFGVVMKPYLGDGGLGELVVVGEDHGIAAIPDGLDVQVAGALGLAGTAANDALDAVAVAPGTTVLISGATGGAGSIALQYAVAAGATVIATARPGRETDFVGDLGAAHTVDYTADVAAQVRAIAPEGVDAVLHLAGDAAALAELLTDSGRIASTLGFGPDQHPAAIPIMADPNTATLERLAADAAAGRIHVPVTATYLLADAPQAFADYTTGALGKLAVTIAEPNTSSGRQQ